MAHSRKNGRTVMSRRLLLAAAATASLGATLGAPGTVRAQQFATLVKDAMTPKPNTLAVNAPLPALLSVFENNEVALVCDGDTFIGLITRIDLINHLRLHP